MENIVVHSSDRLNFKGKEYRCSIGRNGVTKNKKEGDGATPLGCFAVREVFYRADRVTKPETVFPTRALEENDGWCDAPEDKKYNLFVKLPYRASHEELWREDNLYDVIVTLGYNDDPPVPGKGSAVFMHVARENYSPTDACVVLALPDFLKILAAVEKNTKVCIIKV